MATLLRALLVVVLLVGVKLLVGPYHLIDDDVHIVQDMQRDLGEYLTLYAREPHFRLRPIPFLSLYLEHEALGLGPDGLHLVSLLWVGLAALLLGAAAWRLTQDRWCAALAAALVVLHPVQCELLGWLAARWDVGAQLSLTAAILCEVAGQLSSRPTLWRLLAPVAYLAALLSKESALVMLPPLCALAWSVHGRPGALASAALRHGAALLACVVIRIAVMGQMFPAQAVLAASLQRRLDGLLHRMWDLLVFPVRVPTAVVPIALIVLLLAVAWVVTGLRLRRQEGRAAILRQAVPCLLGILCCEVTVSSMPAAPHLDNIRFVSLSVPWILLFLVRCGRGPLLCCAVASALIQPGNLRAHAEAIGIHREVEATLRHELAAHDELLIALELPRNHVGVKTFFGSCSSLPALLAPGRPYQLTTLVELGGDRQVIDLADELLAPTFAAAAYVRHAFRRYAYDPAARRLQFIDRVLLQPGESLVPGSARPGPPLPASRGTTPR